MIVVHVAAVGDPGPVVIEDGPAQATLLLSIVRSRAGISVECIALEDVYQISAESFQGPEHLARIQEEAKNLVSSVLAKA